jgi:hypothetical protein
MSPVLSFNLEIALPPVVLDVFAYSTDFTLWTATGSWSRRRGDRQPDARNGRHRHGHDA